jgi:RNA polymerase sigma-70 factor (ECF subfamily)
VAALQHLPTTQRAVLLLREVLQLSAAEVAEVLDTSVAAVNSALQRARAAVAERVPPPSQQAELAALGDAAVERLVAEFVAALEAADVGRLTGLLTADVRMTMPPLPAWFAGAPMVARFFTERVFATPWRLDPLPVNGQPGLRAWQLVDGVWTPGAVAALSVRRGRISRVSSFVDPAVVGMFAADR